MDRRGHVNVINIDMEIGTGHLERWRQSGEWRWRCRRQLRGSMTTAGRPGSPSWFSASSCFGPSGSRSWLIYYGADEWDVDGILIWRGGRNGPPSAGSASAIASSSACSAGSNAGVGTAV